MAQPGRWTLGGILATSTAVALLGILLTRVFAAVMPGYLAFMLIALVLLGSGCGGICFFLVPRWFPREKTAQQLVWLAALFGATAVTTFTLYLFLPLGQHTLANISLTSFLLAIPFAFAGATAALIVTRFSRWAGQIAFFNLVGVAVGCWLSLFVLSAVGAISGVLLVGVLGGATAVLFQGDNKQKNWQGWYLSGTVLLLALLLFASNLQWAWLPLPSATNHANHPTLLHEAWNILSRVTLSEDPTNTQSLRLGMSTTYPHPDSSHLLLAEDSHPAAPLPKWDGSQDTFNFLPYDLSNIAYQILLSPKVFVMGAGGGQAILAALFWQASEIKGAELNPAVVEVMRHDWADYTGHLYDQPSVAIATGDARTLLAQSHEQFDLIQASFINSEAVSAWGAISEAENGWYTQEAFHTFFRRLAPQGIVSYSSGYVAADPTETLRLVNLGLKSWRDMDVLDASAHLVVIANGRSPQGIATILLKRAPFTAEEVLALRTTAESLQFTVLYAPGYAASANPVQDLVMASDQRKWLRQYPLDLSAPTDDRPFFFHVVNFLDTQRPLRNANPAYTASVQANWSLLTSLGVAGLIAVLFIVGPSLLGQGRSLSLARNIPYLLYHAALGVGSLLILFSTMQRFALYLGSPAHTLSLVLCPILLGGGLSGFWAQGVPLIAIRPRLRLVVGGLLLAIAFHLLIVPFILRLTLGFTWPVRAGLTLTLTLPLGLLMGQPFPLGMRWIEGKRLQGEQILPWLWVVQAVFSVLGWVLAAIFALSWGYRVVTVLGMACYAVAVTQVIQTWRPEK